MAILDPPALVTKLSMRTAQNFCLCPPSFPLDSHPPEIRSFHFSPFFVIVPGHQSSPADRRRGLELHRYSPGCQTRGNISTSYRNHPASSQDSYDCHHPCTWYKIYCRMAVLKLHLSNCEFWAYPFFYWKYCIKTLLKHRLIPKCRTMVIRDDFWHIYS